MKFGCTRVSTSEQNPDLQKDQLLADGCDEILSEVASGAKNKSTCTWKFLAAEALYTKGDMSVNEIANNLSISKATLYKYLRHQSVKIGATESVNISW